MSSHWPTDLDADGKAPPNIALVASGDEHLMRQAMYQVQAAVQLKDRGFEVERFQTPLVGKMMLQMCKAGAARAACIELDQAIDDGVAASCRNTSGCFEDLCNQHWLEERPRLDRALTSIMNR